MIFRNIGCIFMLLIFNWSTGCSQKWIQLFNGKNLKCWDTYLGPAFDTVSKKMDAGKTPGLNNDPDHVFSVDNDNHAIRISGSHFGGISTIQEYKNYHLQLKFKWGILKWSPRKKGKRDSGLLYHAVGPHGADGGFWMRSQELQIQEGDCGDYWGVAGGIMDIPAVGNTREKYTYHTMAPMLVFSETSPQYRRCNKMVDAEKPNGTWNTIDLYCVEDTAVHVINGKTVMVLYHSRQLIDGVESPLKEGKIQIQSEGAEIYFKNIKIQNIHSIPKKILHP